MKTTPTPAVEHSTLFRKCVKNGTAFLGEKETVRLAFPLPDGRMEISGSLYVCRKFGGKCSSGNQECRKLRGATCDLLLQPAPPC
jgi:hypothetical protein